MKQVYRFADLLSILWDSLFAALCTKCLNDHCACVCCVQSKLTETFSPMSLEVIDESAGHAGHAGNPSGSPDAETHFRYSDLPK